MCKHVAATLYAVKDKISEDLTPRLAEMSENELRDTVIAGALDSKQFRELLDGLMDA